MAVGVSVHPQGHGVAELLVNRPEDDDQQTDGDKAENPVAGVLRVGGRGLGNGAGSGLRRQGAATGQIEQQADDHAHAGGAETVVPAQGLAQAAADQGRQERAKVDADIKDAEGPVPARIARGIQTAHLGRDVRLEQPVAADQAQQRRIEQTLEGHEKMAHGHDDPAKNDTAMLAQVPVGQPAAEQRREIDQAAV